MNQYAFPDVWLTTLDQLKLHRGINQKNVPLDGKYPPAEIDALLTQCILEASSSIVSYLARLPLPYVAEKEYEAVYDSALYVNDDLLEVQSILDPTGGSVELQDVHLLPRNLYPKYSLSLVSTCSRGVWWMPNALVVPQVFALTGIYGYVPHWVRAWKPSGQTTPAATESSAGGISASAEVVILSGEGAFEIGGYGRIETEYVQFTAWDAVNKRLGLVRGVLGTTPAAHGPAKSIDLFIQHSDIQTKATEWAAYLYKSLEQLGEEVKVFEGGVQFVRGLSPLVKSALRKHKRL